MSKRIPRAVREAAVEHLLCAADSRRVHGEECGTPTLTGDAYDLAGRALGEVWGATMALPLSDDCAEAAALLLDGWRPGDAVESRS